MIVDRHHAHAIATGKITEHRQPVAPKGPTRSTPRPGRRLPVRTPTGHYTDVLILSCKRSTHGHAATLTPDALANLTEQGTLAAWARRWLLERDTQWLAQRCTRCPVRAVVWSRHHEAEAALTELDDDALLARFDRRWADRPVWVIRWEPAEDPPLYLAQTGGTAFQWDATLKRWLVDGRVPDGLPDPGGDGLADRGYTTRRDVALASAGDVWDTDPGRLEFSERLRRESRSRRDTAAEVARALGRAA